MVLHVPVVSEGTLHKMNVYFSLKNNYNMYIQHVADSIKKMCAHKQSKCFICKSCHFNLQGKREKTHTFTQKSGGTSEEYQRGNQKVHTKRTNDTFDEHWRPKEKPHTCTQNSDNNSGEYQGRPEKEQTFTQNLDNTFEEYTPSNTEWTCTCCHAKSP